MTFVVYGGIAVTAVLSCVWDLRQQRIPNSLTIASAVAGWSVHAAGSGGQGLAFAIAGSLVGLLLFLPWFLLRAMGGGDVKLLAAFGAWLGPIQIVWACLFAMLAGGIVAAVVLIVRHRERPRSITYAIPVAAGVAAVLWLR
jgi:prepilin peptidase CpaA